ncbi:MAG: DUF72 domain-containing protein [Actinobacteria bacterium]|nr:MAG: DUF72 domain-containing protein [Actinomycetota bacterium]
MVYIGTSGWSYPHWFNTFYPDNLAKNKAFQYYQEHFETVELNVTFYRLVHKKTFEGWNKNTSDNFVFAIKASRYITHNKRLIDPDKPLNRLFDNLSVLGEKAGPVLWQLPSNFHKDLNRLEVFLKALPKNYRHAFEFRHPSWFSDDTYKLLRNINAALVFADSPRWPLEHEITADFLYIRFHGGKELYGSNYSGKELGAWAKKIKKWSAKYSIYSYFNNDYNAYAPKNALYLKELLK